MPQQIHSQRQHFTVLPQQIQLLKLFHLTTLELDNRIQDELLENPLLDEVKQDEDSVTDKGLEDSAQDFDGPDEYQQEDTPDYTLEHQNYLSDTDRPQRPIPELADFRRDLKEQLRGVLTDEKQLRMAEYLIDSLNDEGMLDQDLSSVADDLSFQSNTLVTVQEVEQARQQLLQLEPAGIGCTCIREFLLLQLHHLDPEKRLVQLGIKLLEKNFNDLTHRNMEKIAKQLDIEENELREVIKLVSSCKLKPLAESTGPKYGDTICFDFVITQHEDTTVASLYRQRSSTLFINHSMNALLNKEKHADKGAAQYLKSKLTSAQWFVSAIQQREVTMLSVMKAIVRIQADYFKDGDMRLLKPMILKTIADEVGVHISTVSRITCNKYADTPFGAILLKDLFSKGIENEQGETVSNRVIQLAIEEAVSGESKSKPYTDQQLVAVLARKGFNIARRTVAKYRELRQIPVVQVRALCA